MVDGDNKRVQKFDVNGKYMLQFGHCGSGSGQLYDPIGIVVHNDKVFVAEGSNHRVSVFHFNAQFSHIIGSGQLSNPWGVAVTSNDQLLVADFNSGIFRFTLDGTYADKFGDGLSWANALTTDIHGFILVGEQRSHCVSDFDKDGVFVHRFGSYGC